MPAAELLAAGTASFTFGLEERYRPPRGNALAAQGMEEAGTETLARGRRYIIKRPRLTRLLDESKARIIMLVAPAGYGKTTLAREWLENREHGWYRGVPASADVAALAVGLAESAGAVIPGAGKRMRERLRVTANPERDVQPLAELLAEDLASWPETAWLAIDDYHFACDSEASEQYVDLLASLSPVRLLLASRKRPRWATSRRILYGELHELGTHALAMTQTEANEVLAEREGRAASGLVALSAGWPAVIGLAALTVEPNLPEGELPETLYEFFAEELYQAASNDVREALCRLSLALSVTHELALFLFGSGAPAILLAGTELGFLVRSSRETYELHPLLQRFLEAKLHDRPTANVTELATELAQFFISNELWDDLFLLVDRLSTESLFLRLLELALPAMVREGRISTIAQWLEFAHRRRVDSPLVDLAEAEVAFCQGDRSRAQVFALRSARRLGERHRLTSRAFWVAGMSAHMLDQPEIATRRQEQARALACDDDSRLQALWGELVSAFNSERGEIPRLLEELTKKEDHSIEVQLRVITGRLIWALLSGHLASGVDEAEAVLPLLARSQDPIVRSTLLNTWAMMLVLVGRYSEGKGAAALELREAIDYRLDFVVPHACLNQAAAELGLRRFGPCEALIDRALTTVHKVDRFIPLHAATIRIRLELARANIARAAAIRRPSGVRRSTPGIEGEFLATRGVALACSGDLDRALHDAASADALTMRPEARVLAACVRAIVDVQQAPGRPSELASAAFALTTRTGNIDSFVAAYRACPPLLQAVASSVADDDDLALLAHIVQKASDRRLQHTLKLSLPMPPGSHDPLSKREAEVLQLVAQGLRNKEIAAALFIEETTVKVHIRHIFEKLGVKSRTEAALRTYLTGTG